MQQSEEQQSIITLMQQVGLYKELLQQVAYQNQLLSRDISMRQQQQQQNTPNNMKYPQEGFGNNMQGMGFMGGMGMGAAQGLGAGMGMMGNMLGQMAREVPSQLGALGQMGQLGQLTGALSSQVGRSGEGDIPPSQPSDM